MRKKPEHHGFKSKDTPPVHGVFYERWLRMNRRCNDKKDINYKNYGGRGIKVLWPSFKDFANDMLLSFLIHVEEFGLKNTSIERMNNNGHYCKTNCKWSTRTEQNQNQRVRKDSKTGIRGITYDKTKNLKWMVQVNRNKKRFNKRCRTLAEAKKVLSDAIAKEGELC